MEYLKQWLYKYFNAREIFVRNGKQRGEQPLPGTDTHISSHHPLPCTLLHIYMMIHHTPLCQNPLHLTLQKNRKMRQKRNCKMGYFEDCLVLKPSATPCCLTHIQKLKEKCQSCSPGYPSWAQPCPWNPLQGQVLLPRGSFAWLGEWLWLNVDSLHEQIQIKHVFVLPEFSSMFPLMETPQYKTLLHRRRRFTQVIAHVSHLLTLFALLSQKVLRKWKS